MRLQIASDLHLERVPGNRRRDKLLDTTQSDVLVLAGDIHRLDQMADHFHDWPTPVVYVHGNHELYHRDYDAVIRHARGQLAGTNIQFLEGEQYVQGEVRFLGCCLWSDFALHERAGPEMDYAQAYAPEHRIISAGPARKLLPTDVRRIHRRSVAWLERKLRQPFAGKTVVVTHYAPHAMSLGYDAAHMPSAAFASDLGRLLRWADLWIHGHIHRSCDYIWAGCRVVANPAGYQRHGKYAGEVTNKDFGRRMVVQV
ncbi:putative phosphodiesterase [Paraburkholderia sp. GAS199]|uniref:metallophosphoesterase n=1 Tax=Paraburkholderia sp. GAS199 TaxID=3035126 RepID=UPI003D252D26